MQVHHIKDGSPVICLIYKGSNSSAHYDLLELSIDAAAQLAVDLFHMNSNTEDLPVMKNNSGLSNSTPPSSSSSVSTLQNEDVEFPYCFGYAVSRLLIVDHKMDDEVEGLIRDVAHSLVFKSDIQIKNCGMGVYKLLSNESNLVSLTSWIDNIGSYPLDSGEVVFVTSKDSICTIKRVDNKPKKILTNETKNKDTTRGINDVFITIYGVPTQLVREDITILDRLSESLGKTLTNIELTSDYSWSTSESDPRHSTATVRVRRVNTIQTYHRMSLVGDGDILLDVNILRKGVDLKGPVNYYTLPGQSTGERRMLLQALRKKCGHPTQRHNNTCVICQIW
jgi:hypothetical protein